MIHHFLLTRFNITLWQHDKKGNVIDRSKWLEERLQLFETYCLPSVAGQSCKDFVWFLLLDESTPETYRDRILSYKDICPNIRMVKVKSGYGFRFVEVFQGVVREYLEERREEEGRLEGLERLEGLGRLEDEYCLSTYLDNDDCLDKDYVANVQKLVRQNIHNHDKDYFITYDYGYQYFTQIGLTTRIKYPNNHFMTLVEKVEFENLDDVKNVNRQRCINRIRTCYGYGSHFMIEANNVAKVIHVSDKNHPMWTEVIHETNVDNDVKMTWDTAIISGTTKAKLKFCFRAAKQICRRTHDKIFPRKWE